MNLPLKDEFLSKIPDELNEVKTDSNLAFIKLHKNQNVFYTLGYDVSKIDTNERGFNLIQSHNEYANTKEYTYTSELKYIVLKATKRGIKFIFISPPKYKTYNENISDFYEKQRAVFFN